MYSECIELIYVLQSLHPRAGYGDLTRYRCELATFIHSFIHKSSFPRPTARSAHSGGGGAEEPYLLR